MTRPIVVKLGGSLAGSGRIRSWTRLVARAFAPAIIAPGGGAFADAVRAAQTRHEFDDRTAHRMAILAMHQTGLMLAAFEPRLQCVSTIGEIDEALRESRIPVWMPLAMVDADRWVPADWSITSDGLAARLGEIVGASKIALVKSINVERGADARDLADQGIVDPAFATIVARARLDWSVFGPGEEAAFSDLLGSASGAWPRGESLHA